MTSKSQLYLHITDLFRRGEFAAGQSELQSAADSLSQAERLECLGNFHFYRHEQQAAVDQFSAIFKQFPEHYSARYHYIVATRLERSGEFAEAFDHYRTAIEVEPTFVDAYIELGALLYKQSDLVGSARCFEHAVEFDPRDLRIYANLRIIYRQLAEHDPATYGQRRDQLELDYPRLETELPPIPEGHQW